MRPRCHPREGVYTCFDSLERDIGKAYYLWAITTCRRFTRANSVLPPCKRAGLVICTDPFFTSQSKQIAAEAIRYKIPTIYQFREFAAAGLMSYGGSGTNGFRQAGLYASRILRAEKAADLPVQQETKAELVINLKTAKTLGIDVPPMLLARAPKHSSKARH